MESKAATFESPRSRCTELENSATEEQKREGYDIADFLLDGNSPNAILQKMITKNPALKTLIDTLDLELIGAEKMEASPPQKRKGIRM